MALLIPPETVLVEGSTPEVAEVARILGDGLPDRLDDGDVVVRHGTLGGLDPDVLVVELPGRGAVVAVVGTSVRTGERRDEVGRTAEVDELRERLVAAGWPAPAVVAVVSQPAVARRVDGPVVTTRELAGGDALALLGSLVGRRRSPGRAPVRTAVARHVSISGDPDRLLFQPPAGADGADTVRVLDARQESLAVGLPPGRHLIRGVAGSGKTVLLVHRARHLLRTHPHWRIQLVCFNRALARSLHQLLDPGPRVWVMDDDTPEPGTIDVATIARLENSRWARRPDALLIDEAQDLTVEDWLWLHRRCDGIGDVTVAVDHAQHLLWPEPEAAPLDVLLANFEVHELTTTYRNTREILEYAWRVVEPALGDGAGGLGVLRPEAAGRSGPEPRVIRCRGWGDEVATIFDHVEDLLARGVEPSAIGIFIGGMSFDHQTRLYNEARRRKIPYRWVTSGPRHDDALADTGAVRTSYIGYLKGLEFSHVIIAGAHQFAIRDGDAELRELVGRRRLYVALTRATDELVVTTSGTDPLVDALRSAAR